MVKKGGIKMDYHYAHKYLVGYSDVDKNNKMKISRIVDMFQNVATWHSKTIGYGTAEMMNLKQGWLVLEWKIKIFRYPVADEMIELRTWSKSPKGLHAYRDFEIVDESGSIMVLAESSWILYDLVNQKPIRLSNEMMEKYGAINRNALEEGISKIKESDINGHIFRISPMRRDIDTNNHVNNAKYVEFFEEILPADVKINEIEIQYRKQTKLGETLQLNFDGKICVMKNENGEVTTIIKIN